MVSPVTGVSTREARNTSSHIQNSTKVMASSAAAISTAAAVAAMNGPMNSSIPSVDLNGNLDGKYVICPTFPAPIGEHRSNATSLKSEALHPNIAATVGSAEIAKVTNIPHKNTMPSTDTSSASENAHNNFLAHNSLSSSNENMPSQGSTVNSNAYVHSNFTVPQHLHFNQIPTYQPFRQPVRDEKPAIFQNLPLRRGKWTQEEERYAKAIIDAFEKGIIHGCENGCTLRAYLSRKLHCQPMRISKKYAGKSIGKQVFMSRLNVSPGREMAVSNHGILKKLEFHFHMSVLQEGIANNLDGTGSGRISSTNSGSHLPGIYQSTSGTNVAMANQSSVMNANTAQNSAWPQYIVPQGSLVPTQTVTVLPQSLIPQTATSATMMPVASSNIHQNLFNAFKQAQTVYATRESASQGGNAGTTVINSINANDSVLQDQNKKNSGNPASSISPDKLLTWQAQQNWLNEAMAIIPTLDPTLNDGRYSPTYTSKSFDDLHQFIGKDCPPVDTERKFQSSQTSGSVGPATYAAIKMENEEQLKNVPKTAQSSITESNVKELGLLQSKPTNEKDSRIFLSAADEYSFFAQQSAIEASKHSAYIREEVPLVDSSRPASMTTNPRQVVSAAINAMNLQIHGDNAQKKCENASNNSKFNTSTTLHRSVPMVSGSERSSSEFGTSRSGSSSSDNDNSDLGSDEGRTSADLLRQHKKRKLNNVKREYAMNMR